MIDQTHVLVPDQGHYLHLEHQQNLVVTMTEIIMVIVIVMVFVIMMVIINLTLHMQHKMQNLSHYQMQMQTI